MKQDQQKKIQALSDWEWTTLVASWRYFETRCSIVSDSFPADVVERFWGSGRYTTSVLDRIARQFAVIDHGTNGEKDWDPVNMPVGYEPWAKFYAFCKAWSDKERGFTFVAVKDSIDTSLKLTLPPFVAPKIKNGRNGIPCFRCETTRRLYPVSEYIRHPQMEVYMDELMVEEVGRDGYKSWWGKSQRICR